ncbi:MAG: VOC family protein [bacterium]
MANSTSMQIFMVSLVVDDYDSAIEHYTKDWGFELLEDSLMDGGKRWVRVAPPGSSCCLLLAQARDSTQRAVIGQQAGGRVFLFMHVSDLPKQVQHLVGQGVKMEGPIRHEDFGKVCVAVDKFGNRWDLIEPKNGSRKIGEP